MLLPGWVIWKLVGVVHAILPLGSRLMSALPTPIGGERFNSSTDLNLNTKLIISAPLQASF